MPLLSSYRFVEIDQKTRLTFLFELTHLEYFMRPFAGLINMKVQQGAQQVVRNIKRLLEADVLSECDYRDQMKRSTG